MESDDTKKKIFVYKKIYQYYYMFIDNPIKKIDHIFFNKLDISKINVLNGRTNKNGIHTRFINYNNNNLYFETDNIYINYYGLVPKKFNDQYIIKIPIYGCTTNFLKIISKIDNFFEEYVPQYKYTKIIKNNIDNNYPPYMIFKLAINNKNEIITSIYDNNNNKLLIKTLDDLRKYLEWKSTIKLICELSFVWINKKNKKYGLSIKILQIKFINNIKQ